MKFVQKEDIIERIDWWFRCNSYSILTRLEFICIMMTTQELKRQHKFGEWGNIGIQVYGPHGKEFKKVSDIFLGKNGQFKEAINQIIDDANIELVTK